MDKNPVPIDPNNLAAWLTLAQIIADCGRSKATIYDDMAEGTFPACFCIGKRDVRWKAADYLAWKRERETRRYTYIPKAERKAAKSAKSEGGC